MTGGRKRDVSPGAALLAAGWLAIPAVQYYATTARTRYQIGEVPDPENAPSVVQWDLSPLYLLLVLLTVLHVLRAFFATRTKAGPDMETSTVSEVAGGTA